MSSIHTRLPSPAMIIACVALIVALGGVSYAAVVLPANSVGSKQITKNAITGRKVKDGTLTAADFKRGQMLQGAPGKEGAQGPAGRSALTALQAGESESGVFAVGGPSSGSGDVFIAGVSFPIPLPHSVDASHVVAVNGASTTHCPAQGQADAGFLCLYVTVHSAEADALASSDIKDPTQAPNAGADKRGFSVAAHANASSTFAGVEGTWTYSEG